MNWFFLILDEVIKNSKKHERLQGNSIGSQTECYAKFGLQAVGLYRLRPRQHLIKVPCKFIMKIKIKIHARKIDTGIKGKVIKGSGLKIIEN